jgi:hypothetical protein
MSSPNSDARSLRSNYSTKKAIVVALQHAIESIRNREVDAGRTQSTPQLWVGRACRAAAAIGLLP